MAKKNRLIQLKAPVQKNDEIEAQVVDLSYQGMGVVKVDHFPIFVLDALPDELVKIQITKVLKNYAFGRVLQRLQDSPQRVELTDQVALSSGIAPLANLAYPAQLDFKTRQVEEVFKKQHLSVTVAPTIGMEDPTHYRNKAQVPVQMINGQLSTGFYRRGSHRLIPTDSFYIQDAHVDQAVRVTRDILRSLGISAYDEQSKKGVVRHIMARWGYHSHQLMVVVVTRTAKLPQADQLVEELQTQLPQLTSVIQNINGAPTNVIMGAKNHVLWGKPAIEDELLGKRYVIGPNSFYQVNPQTTATVYQLAVQAAQLKPSDTVIDAYCGIGTIALTVADQVKQVYGVEVVPEAIKDAQYNAQLNHVQNVDFVTADAPEQMFTWSQAGLQPDVIFVDPPRKGLTPELIDASVSMQPKKIVYVSCNPATLARDAAQLAKQGYQIVNPVQPVDQFPQTLHVECVVTFVKS
ncbi:23S rRNA (uracil(1939)-C(5))-methyltransferase RlmD [Convivina praedatoris]|uniref:RNA methyltransferase n=1 Tax=Convivina praedatoris TaxID=2880963 RepID=A0ABM9CZU0_9LACO|nr:23S rRNA (uracil(1939)-C(5))-methyltransferase RlmD [Convivina sp. LMG 32447]CAH1850302.1 putative RNA methyltransferase [Convivina sp. LMG 32447]CAH1850313.1 putative RNA methyltransferase [Convivina sp. LMG 32447]CAH1850899.1 putative RNA methyltransferase [Convivina sp. LMG 32447]